MANSLPESSLDDIHREVRHRRAATSSRNLVALFPSHPQPSDLPLLAPLAPLVAASAGSSEVSRVPGTDAGAPMSAPSVSRSDSATAHRQNFTPAPGSDKKIPAERSDKQLEQNDDYFNEGMDI